MTLFRRLFRLFVDSAWLAAMTLASIAVCAVARHAGLPPEGTGPALLAGLVLGLAIDILRTPPKRR